MGEVNVWPAHPGGPPLITIWIVHPAPAGRLALMAHLASNALMALPAMGVHQLVLLVQVLPFPLLRTPASVAPWALW